MKIDKEELKKMIKFTLFSISAGAIEFGLFTILTLFTNWKYWPCYLIALVASVLWNFTLNRKFTFKSSNNIPVAMLKVILFYFIFTPTSTLLGNYLAETLLWNDFLVTILNMLANFVLEYFYSKYIVLKKTKTSKKANKIA